MVLMLVGIMLVIWWRWLLLSSLCWLDRSLCAWNGEKKDRRLKWDGKPARIYTDWMTDSFRHHVVCFPVQSESLRNG